ncbi:hypothetical protein W97_05523 [Coniosporium apollinis CBS 100218]|uniref:Major facilitator superfamily (MFS) profile domain-containing protein n=1 Tax=Coniosporium apollinis (strain CBS 100218) TaxID=1168221 RepID=R7YXM1_CONA1|nr:uncharacterized protein W97_05523 [Coniosporium apollinis CBS 100218]EON66426.1 hypothetical protein W97_05523 [Coniosporium apollinis CBS 100218]
MPNPKKPAMGPRRKSSTMHYQTFPTKPPTSRGPPPSSASDTNVDSPQSRDSADSAASQEHPLPYKQLAVLAVIALAEQTAFNSISPYLPDMASRFPEVEEEEIGLYVGMIASAFALAQVTTNFFWGWLSDRIGRKPVILLGTVMTAACFIGLGFSTRLWHAILVQVCMGLVNGNQGIVSTILGEITDRSNQSTAFQYLPVIYGLGAITGPLIGGVLVFPENPFKKGQPNPYPYLVPNLVSAALLLLDTVIAMLFLEESLHEAQNLPPLGKRVGNLFTWIWQFASSTRPTYLRPRAENGKRRHSNHADGTIGDGDSITDTASHHSLPSLLPQVTGDGLTYKQVFNRDTVLLLITSLIFNLSNVTYLSLYPIFGQAPPPTGRALSPEEIGLSLAFSGVAVIVLQVCLYGKLHEKLGYRTTYKISFAAFTIGFFLTPWVGYKDPSGTGANQGKTWLWIELGLILVIVKIASVGGLAAFLPLLTNSSPNHAVLGTLNGLAQTLGAAGRAVGPFISGGLFTAATHVKPKGELLAFGVFGGIAFVGFLLCYGIRGQNLEADGGDEEEGSEEGGSEDDGSGEDEDEEGSGHGSLREEDEEAPLLRR